MYMFRKERNEGRVWHQGKSLRRRGGQHGRLVAAQEKRALASARRLHDCGQRETGIFREFALSRQFGPKLGKRLNRAQQPPEIVCLHRHDEWCGTQSKMSVPCRIAPCAVALLVSLMR